MSSQSSRDLIDHISLYQSYRVIGAVWQSPGLPGELVDSRTHISTGGGELSACGGSIPQSSVSGLASSFEKIFGLKIGLRREEGYSSACGGQQTSIGFWASHSGMPSDKQKIR